MNKKALLHLSRTWKLTAEGTQRTGENPIKALTCHHLVTVDIGKDLSRQMYQFVPQDKSRNAELQLQLTQRIIRPANTASFME